MSLFGWDYPPGCSHVPSDEDDGPLACPICDKPNWDEDNEVAVYPSAPEFCSAECAAVYDARMRAASATEAATLADYARIDAEVTAAIAESASAEDAWDYVNDPGYRAGWNARLGGAPREETRSFVPGWTAEFHVGWDNADAALNNPDEDAVPFPPLPEST